MVKRVFKFGKMPLSDLVQLRSEIETALNARIAIEREELQSKIAALSALEGGSRRAAKVIGKRKKGRGNGAKPAARKPHPLKGRVAAPKYRGPGGETWAGRGLSPRWLTALEKKGKKREQFLIAKV